MKKVCLLIMFSVFFLLETVCYATTFSEPVKIGSYSNPHAGGPGLATATGYTSSTDVSFTFGEGDSALTFVYKNNPTGNGRGSSFTVGVMVGNDLLTNFKCGDVPEIYRIKSDNGITVYIGKGIGPGLEQVFFLIAKNKNGKVTYTRMGTIAAYIPNLEFVDSVDEKRMGTPACKDNIIAIPIVSRAETEYIHFVWNPDGNSYGVLIPKKYVK